MHTDFVKFESRNTQVPAPQAFRLRLRLIRLQTFINQERMTVIQYSESISKQNIAANDNSVKQP